MCVDITHYDVVVVVLVVGPIRTAAMKAYCTLTPMEFRHSSPEALHTKRRERPLLARDGTKAKEFS
jgi:secreted trypsin-like serine protease